jgi:hypothetical protein
MPDWRAQPAFAPWARWLARIDASAAPAAETLDLWARESALALPDGRPLRIEPSHGAGDALGYERRVREDAVVGVRPGSWHDAFNVLAWLAFPRTKAALNARHVAEGAASTANRRSRVRDAATLVDESGLLLACDAPGLVRLLREHAWRELFVERAQEVGRHCFACAIGHGLLDRLRRPYRALTAKTLVLTCSPGQLPREPEALDAAAADVVASRAFDAAALAPLPVAALPGWDREGLGAALFDDASVFRSKVLRSPR